MNMTTAYKMNRYSKDTDITSSVFRNEDRAKAKNVFASRSLQNDLDRERGIEKMHLETIRREQMMLQKELHKVRTKGQYMNGNRPIIRPHNRLRHTRYIHDQRRKPKDTEGEIQSDQLSTSIDSAFPSINNVTTKRFAPKSTPLQREYEQKMQFIQRESTREETISQRRLKEMSRRQEKLVARVADLTEGLKQTTTSGKEIASSYKGSKYYDGKFERKMSQQEKLSNNLKTLPSIFSLPIPRKASLSESPYASRRLDVLSPLASDPPAPTDIMPNSGGAPENNRMQTNSEDKQRTAIEESKRVADMIANPTLWFDQDKYAPDGGLRTIHMLPDSEDIFHEAKKARYLRWKDPQAIDRELSVTEVFASKKKTRRQSKLLYNVPVVKEK